MNDRLSLLVLHEGDSWVVQCLQHDIATQGDSVDFALTRWSCTLRAYTYLSASLPPPAPDHYWSTWKEGKPMPDVTSLGSAEVEVRVES